MNNVISLIRNFPVPLKNILRRIRDFYQWDSFYQKSWSQEGEDLILSRFFGDKTNGFYVDVGAHHPLRFSNTYKLYKQGWRGINIDAMPGSMLAFNKLRNRDINLEIPISSKPEILEYSIFNESALNGFNASLSEQRNISQSKYKIIKTIPLQTKTLSEILEKYLPEEQEIEFLSIDAEGMDFEVVKSNDWKKFRPQLVLVEILYSSLADIEQNELTRFLIQNEYEIYAKTVITVFFRRIDPTASE